MKYYEYSSKGGAPYYALIAANSEAQANKEYRRIISELDGAQAKEITENDARTKFEEGSMATGIEDAKFDAAIKNLPAILLVDGSLC